MQRRSLLRRLAASVTGAGLLTGSAVAETDSPGPGRKQTPIDVEDNSLSCEYDPTHVNWNSDRSLVRFHSRLQNLSEDRQRKIARLLSVKQEVTLANAQEDNLSHVRRWTVEADESPHNLDTSPGKDAMIPTSHKESLAGHSAGIPGFRNKLYTFEHTIEWSFDKTNYKNNESSYKGRVHHDDWKGVGFNGKSYLELATYFEHNIQWKFEHEHLPQTAEPEITLRGNKHGEGTTVSKDADDIFPNLDGKGETVSKDASGFCPANND